MKRFLIIYALIAVAFTSCIENDIPLPVIVPKITSMEVDGATSIVINSDKRTVNITLNEQTDIKRTNIRSVTFDNKQTTMSWDITGEHDLSNALSVIGFFIALLIFKKSFITSISSSLFV